MTDTEANEKNDSGNEENLNEKKYYDYILDYAKDPNCSEEEKDMFESASFILNREHESITQLDNVIDNYQYIDTETLKISLSVANILLANAKTRVKLLEELILERETQTAGQN
jgi:hypothetical protein